MKVGIVGGGISGLGAALALSKDHEVSIFERQEHVGGHSCTPEIQVDGKKIPVDVAFVAFSPPVYKNLSKLFTYLHIETNPMAMGWSVSTNSGEFEYSASNIFADWRNFFRPRFWGLLFEIARFALTARKAIKQGDIEKITINEFLNNHGFSTFFREHFLYPTTGSIWSGSFGEIANFPASMLLEFLDKHHLLERPGKQPMWRTVKNGSQTYVRKLKEELKQNEVVFYENTEVLKVERDRNSPKIITSNLTYDFDAVIVATHADRALAILDSPFENEKRLLGSFDYEKNRVVLHSDISHMPKRKKAWSSWNFYGNGNLSLAEEISLTYWMDKIQKLETKTPILVTLNPQGEVDSSKIYKEFTFYHPLYTPRAYRAQVELPDIQGEGNVYFCGSYFGYGFHEDGLTSGLTVAKLLGSNPPWEHET